MRYLPKSPSERKKMLEAIGVASAEELFSSIPEKFRLKKQLNLPAADVGSGNHRLFQSAREGKFARLYEFSGRGRLQPFAQSWCATRLCCAANFLLPTLRIKRKSARARCKRFSNFRQ